MAKKTLLPDYTVEEIIDHFGGPQQLAAVLECRANNISMWRGFVPRGRAYEIQVKSGGKFVVERMPIKRREAAATT